jgi:hypothetical protein
LERTEELREWTPGERSKAFREVSHRGELTVRERSIVSEELKLVPSGAGSFEAPLTLRLIDCVIEGTIELADMTFGEFELTSTTVNGSLDVRRATFVGDFRMDGTAIDGEAYLWRCEFQAPVLMSGPLFNEALTFSEVTFRRHALMQCAAKRVRLFQARFVQGVDLLLRHAVVVAEHVAFEAPSLIADSSHGGPPDEHLRRNRDQRPRIESLRRSDVGNLLLSNCDLAGCHFYGAHRLDQLRVDGDPTYAMAPRWTRRRIIAEEADVRVRAGESIWQSERTGPTDPGWRRERHLRFDSVAAIYRGLRKGQEERKDEPGAADFYYGEMEMRRRAAAGMERALLWLYRTVAGYGLRASRAVAGLAITIVVFALGYYAVGFDLNPPLYRAGLFSLESTSSLFRTPATAGFILSPWGETFQVVERLLGPLFFALVVLALRGRVKR